MNIQRIRLAGAYGHTETTVELPQTGIVAVTGGNGAGKSGLFLEAISVALWGKTLRGAPAWSDAIWESSASVWIDGLEVVRHRAKGKTHLHWRPSDDGTEEGKAIDARVRLGGVAGDLDVPVFETATKAQEALDELIIPHDVWRRTSALSSADAATFSLATDGERKRLLESIFGVERFDAGLEDCRADLQKADARARTLERDRDLAARSVEHENTQLGRLEAELEAFEGDPPPPVELPPGKTADELLKLLDRCRADARRSRERGHAIDQELQRLARTGGAADAEADATAKLADRLVQHRDCPTCGQEIALARLEELRQAASAARLRAAEDRKQVHADVERLRGERAELALEGADLDAELTALDKKYRERDAIERQAAARAVERDRWEAARTRLAESVGSARVRLDNAREGLSEAAEKLSAVDREIDTLKAVEQVLGLKGPRVQLLARGLGGLEAIANSWLPRLGLPGLGLRLRPYSEKKSGGQSDAISMEVAGAGGGHGYKAASAGERRRIDLAVLLALGEVAAAARGVRQGTLIFDELFDALDQDGVAAVTGALEELAQARCVVVISHNQELVAALPAVRSYHVEGGAVT